MQPAGSFWATQQHQTKIYYYDSQSKQIKIATHVVFDKAGYTLPLSIRSYTQHVLCQSQTQGTTQHEDTAQHDHWDTDREDPTHSCKYPITTGDAPKPSHGGHAFSSTGITALPTICNIHHATAAQHRILQVDAIKPYDIWLSQNPFHACMTITIPIKGPHPTLGFLTALTPMHHHCLQLTGMVKSTPAYKIPQWHSTLKQAIFLNFNGQSIATEDDLKQHIAFVKANCSTAATIQFATVQPHPLHPQEG